MPKAGDDITGTIRLVRELGAGGMGSVWVADHSSLQTQVVVKFMHAELALNSESMQRFSREAAASANVKSPHVVQMLDHGLAPDGSPFIVMELLEGEDLAARIARTGPMSLAEIDVVISQTCKALARAHERGIVHRDIKPQNLFLTSDGGGEIFVKVLDFGIAKASELTASAASTTKTGAMMGTPYYMSPEQVVGAKDIDHRTDLWALGVVAFECATGRKPFDAETVGGLAVAICGGTIPVPSQVYPALTPAFDAWFARVCTRDTKRRFASAKEMADALHAAVTGMPARASISDGFVATVAPAQASALQTGLASQTGMPLPPPPPPMLEVTTQAPVTGGELEPAGVPKRGGKGAFVALGVAALLVVVGVGVKVATGGTTAEVGSAQAVAGQAALAAPSQSVVVNHPPSPSADSPVPTAPVVASASPPPLPPGSPPASPPVRSTPPVTQQHAGGAPHKSAAAAPSPPPKVEKPEPVVKPKDRDSIE